MLTTLDRAYYTPDRVGMKTSKTPEGFLVCEGVPIARVGEMLYADGELEGLESGKDGILRVTRGEDVVFDPMTISSFNGKPVTNDHPDEEVTPENWRKLAVGYAQNPRRGEGRDSDLLLADLIITDPVAIKDIESGKKEVSCGYQAEYEQDEPGKARQKSIQGNHIALVKSGRCGPMCAIQDEAPKHMAKKAKINGVLDRLMHLVKGTKDNETIEKEFAAAKGELEDAGDEDRDVHIHINANGTPAASEGSAEVEDEDPADGEVSELEALKQQVAQLSEIVAKLTKAEKSEAESHADLLTDDEGTEADKDQDEDEDEGDDEDESEGQMTNDSAHILELKSTIALAEILAPGIKIPTADAKMEVKQVQDAACLLRRRALRRAMTGDKAAIVKKFVGDTDLKAATCDAVSVMFRLAAENVRDSNNGKVVSSQQMDGGLREKNKSVSEMIAGINKRNSEFWNKR